MAVQSLRIIMAVLCAVTTAVITSAPVALFALWCYTGYTFFLGATFVWVFVKSAVSVSEYWQRTQHIAVMAKYLSMVRKKESEKE